ncbi:MAG: hypothetical protein IJF71_01730 [Clostridia bacterium]|nr:hypothetical protein [Clostridia bacterium]
MENKITKERLNNHIAYDWMKYIAIVLAVIFAWSLIFTVCATRIQPGQQFKICLIGMYRTQGVDAFKTDLRTVPEGSADGYPYFGDDVLEIISQTYNLEESSMAQVWSTHIAAGEGDVVIANICDMYTLIDQGVIYALGDVLTEIDKLAYYNESTDQEYFKSSLGKPYSKMKGEELIEAIRTVNKQIDHYKAQANKIRAFIERYPSLALNYARGSYTNEMESFTNPTDYEAAEVEESKLWAIDMTLLSAKLREKLTVSREIDHENPFPGYERINDYAIGCLPFKERNRIQFYESISVACYMIDTYLS